MMEDALSECVGSCAGDLVADGIFPGLGLVVRAARWVAEDEQANKRRKSRYSYCAGPDDCDCGLTRVCLERGHRCGRLRACTGGSDCTCGASLKLCTDLNCGCSRPKVYVS